MTIIRITQARSITHTEFRLGHDYRPVPLENFRLAREWADQGLLAPTDAHHLLLIENMMNWIEAKRKVDACMAAVTNREVDEYVEKLKHRCDPPAPAGETAAG